MGRRPPSCNLALGLLLAFAIRLPAQSMGRMVVNNVSNSVGDVWDVWTSPFRADGRDWLTTAAVVGSAIVVSPLDDNVDRWAFRNRNDAVFNALKPIREGGFVFSGRAITPLALGALTLGVVTKNQRLQEGLFGCLASYGASSVVRNYVVYPLIARTRPDTRQPGVIAPPAQQGDQYNFSFPGSHDWGEHSLPGGHIANVFACSEFLTRRFSMGYVEPAIWSLAVGVGIGRTIDRRHWVSDQLLGAMYGFAVGKEVAIRSGRRVDKKDKPNEVSGGFELYVAPDADGWRVGLNRAF